MAIEWQNADRVDLRTTLQSCGWGGASVIRTPRRELRAFARALEKLADPRGATRRATLPARSDGSCAAELAFLTGSECGQDARGTPGLLPLSVRLTDRGRSVDVESSGEVMVCVTATVSSDAVLAFAAALRELDRHRLRVCALRLVSPGPRSRV